MENPAQGMEKLANIQEEVKETGPALTKSPDAAQPGAAWELMPAPPGEFGAATVPLIPRALATALATEAIPAAEPAAPALPGLSPPLAARPGTRHITRGRPQAL